MTDHDAYFAYLRTRSWRAALYRRLWLYPRLCRHLRGRVLDVGCGIGDLLRHRNNTVGVDVNPDAVTWCRAMGLAVEPMMPDHLPFADQTFDGAVLDNVLEHLFDPAPLLAELRRVLRPQATVVVGVPGQRGYASDADHKAFYDPPALALVMKQAGFNLERMFGMPVDWAWLDKQLRQYCVYGVFRRA